MDPIQPKRPKHEFLGQHWGVDENEFAVSVGFSRDPTDEESLDGLLVQRGRGPEEDTPGIDGVYVEIPIQRHVVYGGITEAILRVDSFTLRFNPEASREMGGFEEILVRFKLTAEEFTEMREALRFVFAGCSCYHEFYDL